jgi:PIN domain nuclease of toxin-antitoxin system
MVLLDTSALIWWVNRHAELSVRALAAIEAERPGGAILISAVSAWEVATFASRGKLGLKMEPSAWFACIGAIPEIRFVPLDNEIAVQSAALPAPVLSSATARLLAATARRFGCALVTKVPALREYPHVKTVW